MSEAVASTSKEGQHDEEFNSSRVESQAVDTSTLTSNKVDQKIDEILSKFKISEKELLTKVKNIKRKTVDRKSKTVVSTKFRRHVYRLCYRKLEKNNKLIMGNYFETDKVAENNNSKLKDCQEPLINIIKISSMGNKSSDNLETNKNKEKIPETEPKDCTKDLSANTVPKTDVVLTKDCNKGSPNIENFIVQHDNNSLTTKEYKSNVSVNNDEVIPDYTDYDNSPFELTTSPDFTLRITPESSEGDFKIDNEDPIHDKSFEDELENLLFGSNVKSEVMQHNQEFLTQQPKKISKEEENTYQKISKELYRIHNETKSEIENTKREIQIESEEPQKAATVLVTAPEESNRISDKPEISPKKSEVAAETPKITKSITSKEILDKPCEKLESKTFEAFKVSEDVCKVLDKTKETETSPKLQEFEEISDHFMYHKKHDNSNKFETTSKLCEDKPITLETLNNLNKAPKELVRPPETSDNVSSLLQKSEDTFKEAGSQEQDSEKISEKIEKSDGETLKKSEVAELEHKQTDTEKISNSVSTTSIISKEVGKESEKLHVQNKDIVPKKSEDTTEKESDKFQKKIKKCFGVLHTSNMTSTTNTSQKKPKEFTSTEEHKTEPNISQKTFKLLADNKKIEKEPSSISCVNILSEKVSDKPLKHTQIVEKTSKELNTKTTNKNQDLELKTTTGTSNGLKVTNESKKTHEASKEPLKKFEEGRNKLNQGLEKSTDLFGKDKEANQTPTSININSSKDVKKREKISTKLAIKFKELQSTINTSEQKERPEQHGQVKKFDKHDKPLEQGNVSTTPLSKSYKIANVKSDTSSKVLEQGSKEVVSTESKKCSSNTDVKPEIPKISVEIKSAEPTIEPKISCDKISSVKEIISNSTQFNQDSQKISCVEKVQEETAKDLVTEKNNSVLEKKSENTNKFVESDFDDEKILRTKKIENIPRIWEINSEPGPSRITELNLESEIELLTRIESEEENLKKDKTVTQDSETMDSSYNEILKLQENSPGPSSNFSSPNTSSNSQNSSMLPFKPFLPQDNDLRNKLKKQLDLLKQVQVKKIPQPVTKVVVPVSSTTVSPTAEIDGKKTNENYNLNDVLLSNEGDHLIVSVIGGYVSDDFEEVNEETPVADSQEGSQQKESITDILLRREFITEVAAEEEKTNMIKPTKTKDITKIKGWKKKQFLFSDAAKNIEEEITIEEHPLPETENCRETLQNYIDYSRPSTSKGLEISDINEKDSLPDVINADDSENSRSAFVSDVLDTFLTNHSVLKISYEVPKLKAEEAISKPASELPVLKSTPPEDSYSKPIKKIKKETSIKPKTLAEKRKLLEMEKQNQLQQTMELTETQYMKQLGKNKGSAAKNIRNELLNGVMPFTKQCWYMATNNGQECQRYVNLPYKKIRLVGSFQGEDLTIKTDDQEFNQQFLNISKLSRIEYKPGPLSKKHKLVKNCNNCEYEVKKLPKIKLVLFPKYGKKLPFVAEQYLHLCKDESGFISNELAQFAVSAVKTDAPTNVKVEFDIPYANHQNKILLRRITKKVPTNTVTKYKDIDNEISNIVSGMLDAIDNQDLDDLIIKDDPDLSELDRVDSSSRPPSPVDPVVEALIRKRNYKKNRTTLELRRLNVQVIEVDVAEDKFPQEEIKCNKEYCRLGCVCKSLMGLANSMPEHCGREACMFKCTCSIPQENNHRSVTLPAGTDLLSKSTMVRLQDEAVKHLAKVEKEFTQTVIKANNQTIVVGGGARERQRRVPKLPKKYTDYVNVSEELANIQGSPEETKNQKDVTSRKSIPIWKSPKPKNEVRECKVKIEKLNLDTSSVLPWCMVHNLYKCYCGGKPEAEPVETQKAENVPGIEGVKEDDEYISYEPRYVPRVQNNDIRDSLDETSARTRSLQNKYYILRNRSQTFKTRYLQMRQDEDSRHFDFEAHFNNSKTKRKKTDDDDSTDNELLIMRKKTKKQVLSSDISSSIFLQVTPPISEKSAPPTGPSTSKTKTSLISQNTPNKTVLLRSQSTPQNVPVASSISSSPENSNKVKTASLIDYEKSFLGLLIPTEQWLDKFKEMLHLSTTKVKNIRLLNWGILMDRYNNGKIKLWLNTKRTYNNVVLTETKDRPSRFHTNISLLYNKYNQNFKLPDIVSSVLSNRLPGNASNAEETFVILVYYCGWEARASIVLKNISEQVKLRLQHKPTPVNLLCGESRFPVSTDVNNGQGFVRILPRPSSTTVQIAPVYSSPAVKEQTKEKPVVQLKIDKPQKSKQDNKLEYIKQTLQSGVEITKIPNPTVKNKEKTDYTPKQTSSKENEPKNSTPEVKQSPNVTIQKTVQLQNTSTIDTTKNILASLPHVKGNKTRWFMVKLENDFSVLRIQNNNFQIKYTHMAAAIRMARRNLKTVRIRSEDKNSQNPGKLGIYAVPDWQDRIFFGPYSPDEDHGLETFRYINSQLINTKTYYQMRGTEQKPIGFWFTQGHSNFIVDTPQNTDAVTQIVNPENVSKPTVEFVDLTENDSDEDAPLPTKHINVDPLYNVLAADFSKRVCSDLTIERISPQSTAHSSKTLFTTKIGDDEVQQVDITKILMDGKAQEMEQKKTFAELQISHKRKRTESPKKPVEIINLDDDDDDDYDDDDCDEPKEVKKRKIPQLMPINQYTKDKNTSPKMTSILKPISGLVYLTSSIPGIGYIEVVQNDGKFLLPAFSSEGFHVPEDFTDINKVIKWLENLLKQQIFHVPNDLSLGLSVWKKGPVRDKFDMLLLNGYYMVCSRGVYDVIKMTSHAIGRLHFTEAETTDILQQKSKILVKKHMFIIGNGLYGPEVNSMLDAEIIDKAPPKIKEIENKNVELSEIKSTLFSKQKDLMATIHKLKQDVSPAVQKKVTRNVGNILCKNFKYISEVEETKNIPNPKTENRSLLATNVKKPETVVIKELPKKKKPTKSNSEVTGVMKYKLVNGTYLMPIPCGNEGEKSTDSKNTTQIVDLTDS